MKHVVTQYDMTTKALATLGTFPTFHSAYRFFESLKPEPIDKWRYIYSCHEKEGEHDED
jgi:hypothetical protein